MESFPVDSARSLARPGAGRKRGRGPARSRERSFNCQISIPKPLAAAIEEIWKALSWPSRTAYLVSVAESLLLPPRHQAMDPVEYEGWARGLEVRLGEFHVAATRLERAADTRQADLPEACAVARRAAARLALQLQAPGARSQGAASGGRRLLAPPASTRARDRAAPDTPDASGEHQLIQFRMSEQLAASLDAAWADRGFRCRTDLLTTALERQIRPPAHLVLHPEELEFWAEPLERAHLDARSAARHLRRFASLEAAGARLTERKLKRLAGRLARVLDPTS